MTSGVSDQCIRASAVGWVPDGVGAAVPIPIATRPATAGRVKVRRNEGSALMGRVQPALGRVRMEVRVS